MSSHFDTAKVRAEAGKVAHPAGVALVAACHEIDRLRAALTEAETAIHELNADIDKDLARLPHEAYVRYSFADGRQAALNQVKGKLERVAAAVSGSKPA